MTTTNTSTTAIDDAPALGTTAATSGSRTLSIISFAGAIAALVFGQTVILPIVAIVLGFVARRQEPAGRTFALWGIILGFVGLFGWMLLPLAAVAFVGPFFLLGLL